MHADVHVDTSCGGPSRRFDVVVVGSGVLGLSVSRALSQAGASVACVGPGHLTPGTASSAAGAMIAPVGEVSTNWDWPGTRTETAFRVACAAAYPDFLAALAEETGQQVPGGTGTVVVANLVNADDSANLAAMRSMAAAYKLEAEAIAPEDVPGFRPARGHEATAALFLPQERYVDSMVLLNVLATAVSLRATLLVGEVSRLTMTDDRVTGVMLLDGSELSAGHVVLAAGTGITALLDQASDDTCRLQLDPGLPLLLPGKGVSLQLADLPGSFPYVLRTPNRDFACGTHLVPQASGQIYLGATNRVSDTPASATGISGGELHSLLHSAIHELNVGIRTASVVRMRFGRRPLTMDHRPLLGLTRTPGLSVATGTYRNGMLMAPLVADLVCEEVMTGRAAPGNLFPALPDLRRAALGGAMTPREVLDEGVGHLTSFILEPGGSLPYDRERELRAFLTSLGRLALDEDDGARSRIRQQFADAPMTELVPKLFYSLVADERGASRSA